MTISNDLNNLTTVIGHIIGDKEIQGIGAGAETVVLTLEYIFNKTKTRKVCTGIIDGNVNAIKSIESLGFKKEGVLKEQYLVFDKIVDSFSYGILRREWEEHKKNIEILKHVKISEL